jgi:Ca2+-binding EF-hand superfamily protein
MWKKIVEKILIWCISYVYNYIDRDNDGYISKEELYNEVYIPILELIRKVNKKRNK